MKYVCPCRERLAEEYDRTGDVLVDLGSDQTSCHNPFNGGYYPVQLSMEEANSMMVDDPENFKKIVHERFINLLFINNYNLSSSLI